MTHKMQFGGKRVTVEASMSGHVKLSFIDSGFVANTDVVVDVYVTSDEMERLNNIVAAVACEDEERLHGNALNSLAEELERRSHIFGDAWLKDYLRRLADQVHQEAARAIAVADKIGADAAAYAANKAVAQ